jgi:hypothetical protein
MEAEIKPFYVATRKEDLTILGLNNVSDCSILDVSLSEKKIDDVISEKNYISILNDFEDNRLSYYSILNASRLLFGLENRKKLKYLAFLLQEIDRFCIENNINYIIAEPSDAAQILGQLISWRRKLKFGQIGLSRIPKGRVLLFSDCFESDYYKLEMSTADKVEDEYLSSAVKNSYTNFRLNPTKPSYYKRITINYSIFKLIRSTWVRIPKIANELSGRRELGDLSTIYLVPNKLKDIKRNLIEKLRKKPLVLDNSNYVTYFLHVQPERSIDVMAADYSDQISVIKIIRRALPISYILYVKDHPANDGAQSYNFYKEISKIPNTKMVWRNSDSTKLIINSRIIFTISGTVAFESALLGKPSVVFSNTFFSKLSNVYVYSTPMNLSEYIRSILRVSETLFNINNDNDHLLLSDILKNSIETDWDGFYGRLDNSTINSFIRLIKRSLID